jgi:seryl-tRNA synthetase
MIDIQLVRDDPELVREKAAQKGYEIDIDKLIELDKERLELIKTVESLRQKRNENAESLKGGKPSDEKIEQGRQIKLELAEREKYLSETENNFLALMKQVPNIPLREVPVGSSEDENVVAETIGEKPKFDFDPKSHIDIGLSRDWIDKERAAKVAGSRFVYLKGDLVRLEWALMQYGMDRLSDQDWLQKIIDKHKLESSSKPFTPILPPAVAKTEVYESTARLDKEETTYKLADDDLWLNASAEHTLAPMFSGEILDHDDLPRRYVGFTTAFRREAGSYGKDTEGIIRLHQFNKLEMESFTSAEGGSDEHKFMVAIQREFMEELETPYQLIQKCTADIGGPNASGWDINCWVPSQNAYRETHTADYMTDYQSRRTNTRYRNKKGEVHLAHTNDATVFSERPLIAIIENNQEPDGEHVRLPKVLQPYMQGREII